MNLLPKVLLLQLTCHHTMIIPRYFVASTVKGNFVDCETCGKERRIVEKSWVDPKKIEV